MSHNHDIDDHECYQLVQCTCTAAGSRFNECRAPETISKLSPTEALNLTLNHPPNSCYALQMVNSEPNGLTSRCSPRDLFSLSVALLKKCRVVKSKFWKEVTWSVPLEGLSRLLNHEHELLEDSPGQGLTRAVLRELHGVVTLAIDLMWIDRDRIQAKGLNADVIRMDVAYFLSRLDCYPQLHRYFKSDKVIDIAWLCWLETERLPDPTLCPYRDLAIDLVEMLFGDHNEGRLRKLGHRLLAISSLDYVALKAADWLGDENVLNKDLEVEFQGICLAFECFDSMGLSYDARRAPFLASSVHLHACNALCRQITAGEQNHPSTIEIMAYTPFVFTNSIKATPEDITRAFGNWEHFIQWIIHGATCQDERCLLVGTSESLDATRQGIELVYFETTRRLRLQEIQEPLRAQVRDLWEMLCGTLGLNRGAMRERYRLLRKCCAKNFPQRLIGVPSPKRYCCSKCETVFYCDRICQKMDWAAHKSMCDPAEFATWDRLVTLYGPPRLGLQPSSQRYGKDDK